MRRGKTRTLGRTDTKPMSTADEQIQRMRGLYGDQGGQFAELWIRRALRTAPIDASVIVPVIEDLYGLAGFRKPRVIIVPSPGVLAFAGTFAARIWESRTTSPTYDPARNLAATLAVPASCKAALSATIDAIQSATALSPNENRPDKPHKGLREAILDVTYSPADLATVNALNRDVWQQIRRAAEEIEALSYWDECIRTAMRDMFGNPQPTEIMAKATQDWAQPLAVALFGENADAQHAIRDAANWWQHTEAGNSKLYDTVCIVAARELHKLTLPEHLNFSVWERCKANGGYRYLHPEFCLVSDFPEMMDESSMDHPTQVRRKSMQQRQAAPVIQWRDGWLV
jgi:hypothetical protein